MIADLHTHSAASDGQYAPAELVRLARERGIEVLALTDHDTLDGLEEALRAGEALGVRVLPGIELGAAEYDHLHILGYGFAPAALAPLCRKLKDGRDRRAQRMIDFLRQKGLELTLEEVEETAGGTPIARPHVAQVLVRRGYADSVPDAFRRYLDTGEFRREVRRFKADARTCLEAVKAGGGKTSLAHPCQIGLDPRALEELVGRLAAWGLDALECRYPTHTPEQEAFYLRLAETYRLHVTGGSDFHGERVKPGVRLAALQMDVDRLLETDTGFPGSGQADIIAILKNTDSSSTDTGGTYLRLPP